MEEETTTGGSGMEDDTTPGGSGRSLPPPWVPIATTVICLLGLADAGYLAAAHYSTAKILSCPTHGFIDCALVTESSYSHPFGIPVVLPGLAWSVAMLVLCSPWGWRAANVWVGRLRLAGSVAGTGMVFYLLWAELIKLHHLCEYCTVMHVLTFALFFVVLFGTALAVPAGEPPSTPAPARTTA
jgi:uncharacterized membrane protein